MPHHAARLAEVIASDFYGGQGLKLKGQPPRKWEESCEVRAVEELRDRGADDRQVRLFLTFVAAVSRDRDFKQLLDAAVDLFNTRRELYEPGEVAEMPLDALRNWLREARVSRKHRPDSDAWSAIASSLTQPGPIATAIHDGTGDARRLLWELDALADGDPRYPLLKGDKSGPLWLGWLVVLGSADLENLALVPVAVDTHVRRVSKALGVVDAGKARAPIVDRAIRAAWLAVVDEAELVGPVGAAGTCAALNSPLWLLGKHGWQCYKRWVPE